jgi:hypothetical protein
MKSDDEREETPAVAVQRGVRIRQIEREFGRIEAERKLPKVQDGEDIRQQRLYGAAMTLGWLLGEEGYEQVS